MQNTVRTIVRWLIAITGLAVLVAGPIMIGVGISGQHQVTDQLAAQKISFPARGSAGLPAAESSYAGQQVTTGPQAKAFSDMIETHVEKATDGLTYSEISAKYLAAAADKSTPTAQLATLSGQRETAFMGESLRGSLLSAYQAWEVTYLVIGLGVLLTGTGAVTLAAAGVAIAGTRTKSHPVAEVTVPDDASGITHPGLTTS